MVFDGGRDAFVFALKRRIFTAHQALKLREFADGFSAQVGLGQHHGAVYQRGIGTDDGSQCLGQFADAGHALPLSAELGMERHVQCVELRHALVERLFEIEVEFRSRVFQRFEIGQIALVAGPEMAGIRQAGPHDLAVAMDDFLAAVACLDIRDQDEAVGKALFRTLVAGDETLLVGLDGQPDDFRRNLQIILLEGAHQHLRPFDETGDFFQQAFVFHQIEAVGEGKILGVMQDDVLAALGIQHDLCLFEARDIVLETSHGDRAGRVETMAIGDVARDDAVDGERYNLGFVMLGAEQADDGLQRAHPAQAFRALAFNAGIGGTLRHGGRAGTH